MPYEEYWICPGMPEIVKHLHERYSKKGEALGGGRNRNVFALNSRWVVKLPKNGDGCTDNDWEGSVSNVDDPHEDDVKYPKTRLVYVGDIPVLFMERVRYAEESYEELPDWVGFVDCGQVGYDWKGKLVAYDYGIR